MSELLYIYDNENKRFITPVVNKEVGTIAIQEFRKRVHKNYGTFELKQKDEI